MPARAQRCAPPAAKADRALYRSAIRRIVEGQPNLSVLAAVDDLLIQNGTGEGDAVRGAITQTGLRFHAPAVVLTAGTFLAGKIHIGETQYTAGRMGDPPATNFGRAPARTPVRDRPAQDRHPAADRRAHARLFGDGRTARRRSAAGDVVPGRRARASAPGVVLDHPYQRAHPRDHPRRAGSFTAVHRPDRRHRPALLSVDRGQGGALRREGQPPDLRRARGAGRGRDLSQRHLHLAAVRRAAGPGAQHPRLRARAHHPARVRDRIRLLRPARPEDHAGDQAGGGPVLRRPDQRHHRLRRGGRAGPARRPQRRAPRARAGRLVAASRRGLWAYWSTT